MNQVTQALAHPCREIRLINSQNPRQPVGALFQHLCQQRFEPLPVVVKPREQQLRMLAQFFLDERALEHAARGRHVQRCRRYCHLPLQPGACGNRQLTGKALAESIDGLDAQPRRIFQQAPVAVAIAPQRRRGQWRLQRASRQTGRGLLQGVHDAFAHFSSRFTRKGNRQHFLGCIGLRQQRQQTTGQHGGLARPGWGLHQERTRDV